MERVGKYEVILKLGEGSTATVYLAHDSFADRDVAVKVLDAKILNDTGQGRVYKRLLQNEASLAGKLVHPHIVQIYDAVLSDEQSYIVMEYVAGGTLDQFCTLGNLLPLERVVEIIFKCTRALDYAYRLGITHRDIKPANILFAGRGENASSGDIKISDFGAAIQAANQTQTQVSGVGSPAYMSPQQVREVELNHQTDIYSLGVVMYQLLAGRLPFLAANNFAMVYQICNVEPPPPSSFRNEVPPGLDAVVARAMHKDLASRYLTWEAFSHDLAQVFRNSQLASRRPVFPDSEKFEALRRMAFFNEFSDVEIWETVRISRWDEVATETVVMKDGESGDHFCFLVEGELRVAKNHHTLNLLTPGDCFGEMAVIGSSGHVRGADVIAQTTAKVFTITGAGLRGASDTCRMHFYQAFLEVLARRLGEANIRLATSLTREAPARFHKTGEAAKLPMFAAEAAGLAALRATGSVRVPEVFACGLVDGQARIELEFLDLRGLDRASGARLGRQLAELHRHVGESFGFATDNFIGGSPQENGWQREWPRFFAERRLKPQLAWARSHGMERKSLEGGDALAERLGAFFLDYHPAPSLLHGDLWGGNASALRDGTPVIFDPAVYYGDREADIAMSELFGGFPESFYAAYREAWPLDPGFENRKTLYNLYHVLNHFNLFGAGYLGQARRMIEKLLAGLKG